MQALRPIKITPTGVHLSQIQGLILITHPEVAQVIITLEEVTVRRDLTQVVGVPQAIALDQGAPAVEVEVAQEADNIKIYDYEKVHSLCSIGVTIFIKF
tara:strand:- start:6507 stop:6803 length:297 start_codon:yes stop_codon:yes gene_type:complete